MEPLCKSADLIFATTKKSIFQRLIRWLTRSRDESPTKAVHVASITHTRGVIEALWTVNEMPKLDWLDKHDSFEIWRNVNWTDEEGILLSEAMCKKIGNPYGFWKLFLIAGDLLLMKFTTKQIFFFRRLLFSDTFPICSWLYAYTAKEILDYEFSIKAEYTDPDQMHDFVKKSTEWKLIKRQC